MFLSYITFLTKTTQTFEDYTKDIQKKNTKDLFNKILYGKIKRNKNIF